MVNILFPMNAVRIVLAWKSALVISRVWAANDWIYSIWMAIKASVDHSFQAQNAVNLQSAERGSRLVQLGILRCVLMEGTGFSN